MALGKSKTDNPRKRSPAILTPAGFLALPYQDGVLFHWEKVGGGNTRYRIRYRDMVGSVEKSLTTTDSMLFIEASEFSKSGGTYVATIEAILPDDRLSQQSPEISFRLTQKTEHSLDIPNNFKARILWANVNAWIRRNLL
jgi:hypothetical protein